ncbi:MAG: transglutaminase family protein [Bacteroidales bacterium]|nr:transglutaminase family protein [Bacteroidales bacterium]MBN2755547.1 transglutaminase family protein [Bacteroidales bacterium]
MELNVPELKAMLKLIDDPDNVVFDAVREKLLEWGVIAVKELKSNIEDNSENKLLIERTNAIVKEIEYTATLNSFKNWVVEGGEDLLKGVYLVAKYNTNDIDFYTISQKIEKIKRDAWLQMNENLTPLEQIKVLNHIIFNIHKFTRNTIDFYSPNNSFIDKVLDNRKGNPIALAIIYLMVGVRLGLPLYGVNLPKNFILAYVEELYDSGLETDLENKIVSFYINPYNNGAVLTKREIDYFLKQQQIKSLDSFYTPCDNLTIVQRLVVNLIYSYEKLENHIKVHELKKFEEVFKNKLPDITY